MINATLDTAQELLEVGRKMPGTDGNDTISGGEGNDTIWGGNGDDSLSGNGGNDKIIASHGNDRVSGGEGNDRLWGNNGNDIVSGDEGDDTIRGGMGEDILDGGDGNDRLISRSDAGEPDIAQQTNESKVYPDQPFLEADDTLIGGSGGDTFRFELLINAKDEIVEKHADPITGKVNWQAVAHENDNVHDHWVDSIGNDVILDFNKSEGDKIEIAGHTVEVSKIEYIDVNNDGNLESIIHLISNQGANGGAHNQDELGTIT
ncbi:MAG: calcium-binding protein, partial [Crocosphaera sp.]|nr:calcium-binding protein [Crocosphaera sp.]